MTARVDRLWPDSAEHLGDDELVTALEGVRVNFVSSVDGAATRDGRSGGLSGPADKRRFELLRRLSDVVLVGAGTVRDEGYGPLRVSEASSAWRRANGMPAHPVFAIASRRLDLDPGSRLFTEAPVRPVIITTELRAAGEDPDLPDRLAEVADLIMVGRERVDLVAAIGALGERGLSRILSEGGPSLFGSLIAADVVDELCVTVEPSLEAGDARRIASSPVALSAGLSLAEVLRSGSTLLLRYARG